MVARSLGGALVGVEALVTVIWLTRLDDLEPRQVQANPWSSRERWMSDQKRRNRARSFLISTPLLAGRSARMAVAFSHRWDSFSSGAASGARKFVEACAAVVVGCSTLGRDVAFLIELQQRRIERAVLHDELVDAGLLDAARDAVSVEGPWIQGF